MLNYLSTLVQAQVEVAGRISMVQEHRTWTTGR